MPLASVYLKDSDVSLAKSEIKSDKKFVNFCSN